MQILGLEPVIATVVFTIVGIALLNVVAWLKSSEAFNVRNAAATAIIAFFTSSLVVGSVIGALPEDSDNLVQFTAILAVIASVAGFDTLVKNGARAVVHK